MIKSEVVAMNDLTYSNRLVVKKSVHNKTQLVVMENLIKTGLSTNESKSLFVVLYSSVQLSENEKTSLLNLTDQYILHHEIKTDLTGLLTKKA